MYIYRCVHLSFYFLTLSIFIYFIYKISLKEKKCNSNTNIFVLLEWWLKIFVHFFAKRLKLIDEKIYIVKFSTLYNMYVHCDLNKHWVTCILCVVGNFPFIITYYWRAEFYFSSNMFINCSVVYCMHLCFLRQTIYCVIIMY